MPILLMIGVFLTSFAMLAQEIALVRLLSFMFAYNYVFVVISLAMLGLGIGAILVHLFWERTAGSVGGLRFIALASGLLSLSLAVLPALITRVSDSIVTAMLVSIPLVFAPFLLAGVLLAAVFRAFPAHSSRLYGMDLLGAASGALAIILVLNALGGLKAMAAVGGIGAVAAAFFVLNAGRETENGRAGRIVRPLAGLLIIMSLIASVFSGARLQMPIMASEDKEMSGVLFEPSIKANIVETRWSAFGRTDLVTPGDRPDEMVFFIDGTAGTPMYRLEAGPSTPAVSDLKTEFPAYLALANLPQDRKRSALIIGPGGGRDILVALMTGVERVTAVEVNPDLVDMVRKYSWYNGGIYDRNNVTVIVGEGRNFLSRQTGKYDVIMLSLPITKTSRSIEGYALTEDFLFTTDSIKDYLAHLSDGGQLIVVAHDPVEIVKLISLSLSALGQQGIDNQAAMDRIYTISSHHFPVFVLGQRAFQEAELDTIHQEVHRLGYETNLLYLPSVKAGSCEPHESGKRFDECGMMNPLLIALNQGRVNVDEVRLAFETEGLDVSPPSDDRPFFYKFQGGLPAPVSLILMVSALVLFALVTVPARRRTNGAAPGRLRFLALFALLGSGFMLVEIAIFQKFVLFLGQPVVSLAVLLASLLTGAGLGSLASARFAPGNLHKALVITSLAVFIALLAYAAAMPALFSAILGAQLATRLLVSALLLMPLGFLMGFPFPLGLRLLKAIGLENAIPWMWGVNGVASVFGSAMAIFTAIRFGFTAALLLGAACYLVISVVFRDVPATHRKDTQSS